MAFGSFNRTIFGIEIDVKGIFRGALSLLIAPSLELKYTGKYDKRLTINPFNRTIFGIEISLTE